MIKIDMTPQTEADRKERRAPTVTVDISKWNMTPRQRAELLTEQDKEFSRRFQQLIRDSQK